MVEKILGENLQKYKSQISITKSIKDAGMVRFEYPVTRQPMLLICTGRITPGGFVIPILNRNFVIQ